MLFYLYKTTNLINGKIYIGVHKSRCSEDSYMGSGKLLISAIEKYGIENFEKTILEYFDNAESMYAREKEIVNEEFLSRVDVYNIKCGGDGGFEWINKSGIGGFAGRKHTDETRKKLSEAIKGRKRPDLSAANKKRSTESWQKHGESMSKALSGKKKSETHKQKISEAVSRNWKKKKNAGLV